MAKYGEFCMFGKLRMPKSKPIDDSTSQTTQSSSDIRDNPLEMISRDHQEHLRLCDKLEEIADSLPNSIDRHVCTCVALALQIRVGVHHAVEEEALFPLLRARIGNDIEFSRTLLRLQDEHRMDEGHCDEVLELLTSLSKGIEPENAEAAGYLLRGLFEGMRRHIAFEEDCLLPKAREMLDKSDLKVLASRMAKTQTGYKAACFEPTRNRR
jgi:hemerythrin-like domain-containing protein